ncbi:MAG: hypothetical protein R3D59_12920 [Paracoccaceae bacterium]
MRMVAGFLDPTSGDIRSRAARCSTCRRTSARNSGLPAPRPVPDDEHCRQHRLRAAPAGARAVRRSRARSRRWTDRLASGSEAAR